MEDKIVQRATVEVLNGIYEQDFLGFSYGFHLDEPLGVMVDGEALHLRPTRLQVLPGALDVRV